MEEAASSACANGFNAPYSRQAEAVRASVRITTGHRGKSLAELDRILPPFKLSDATLKAIPTERGRLNGNRDMKENAFRKASLQVGTGPALDAS